jgi:2-dehydro-3-deoxyphosphogluconate aldolase/(4S)-4-hydroxy-2-oxoglutarate aldolase
VMAPINPPGVLETCLSRQIPCFPGAMTPSEVLAASRQGAHVVKLFPAQQVGGAAMIRALRDVAPDLLLIPTGGVEAEHLPDYLQAGALAIGAGGALLSRSILANRNLEELRKRSSRFLQLAEPFRTTLTPSTIGVLNP